MRLIFLSTSNNSSGTKILSSSRSREKPAYMVGGKPKPGTSDVTTRVSDTEYDEYMAQTIKNSADKITYLYE